MTDDPRAVYRAELARRAKIGRPTPPADTVHRWPVDVPPGTRHVDDEQREHKRAAERDRISRRKTHIPPRIPIGPDRSCGNCGAKVRQLTHGRCKTCDAYYRVHGEERHVTPRYGASKL